MSTVVMNNPVFECTELFKNATAAKPQDTNQQSRLQHYSDDQQQQAISSCSSNLRRSYTSLVNLIEQHRKLDRSVSEPTSRYKTELCRPFEENGSCKYGDKCQFAHGYNELRNLARHPKYKTELCRTFHKIGFCPYGPRCHFVHNFEEARIHNLKVSAQLSQSTSLQLQSQSLYPSEFTHHHQQSSLHQTIGSSNTNTQVAGLTPLLQPLSVNMSLLEHLASSPQVVAAVAAASASASSSNLIRANSLNLAAAAAAAAAATATAAASGSSSSDYPQRLTLQRSNSLCVPQQHQHQHHYQHQLLHIQSRPKPLNLSPTFSLGSNADSTSPSSSLSQSPTNSMASFFSDDPGLNSCFPFNSNQEETLDSSTRTPSPLPSVHAPVFECPRLPVFNRISRTIADLEHLHI